MTFLPIVQRELRVAARKPATYWSRFWTVAGVTAFWLLLVITNSRAGLTSSLGSTLFSVISFVAEGCCLAAGIFLTADCLSEEKREGTLGLLFLTDLTGFDVVLGKLTATSVHVVYSLLAAFPLMGLSLLLGGLSVGEFWRVLLVLPVTLFLSLSAGIFISALNREVRQAMGGTLFLIALPTIVLPVIGQALKHVYPLSKYDSLAWTSPFFTYACCGDSDYYSRGGAAIYWTSLGILLAMGAAFLIGAALILPHRWQEAGPTKAPDGRSEKTNRLRFGTASSRKTLRTRLLDWNPFYWLAIRDRLPQIISWVLFGSISLLWICLFVCIFIAPAPTNQEAFVPVLFITFGMHWIFKGMVAIEAARRLHDDRQSGALELLLVTPLPEACILAGQKRALLHQFKLPMAIVLSMNLALIWLVVKPHPLNYLGSGQGMYLSVLVGGILMLLLDFSTLGWVGMHTGLRARKHHHAVLFALAQVFFIPWISLFVIWGCVGIFFSLIGSNSFKPIIRLDVLILLLWFAIGIANNLFFGWLARAKLRRHLRRYATGTSANQLRTFLSSIRSKLEVTGV